MLGDFNCTMDKMEGDGGNKTQRLTDAILVMPCQNSLWIMGLRIYGEGRIQIPLSSPASIDPLAQDRVYTDVKIANNTKINHIMVCFTDHYNAISIDRLHQKLKLEKIHGALIILFDVSPSSAQLQRLCFFY